MIELFNQISFDTHEASRYFLDNFIYLFIYLFGAVFVYFLIKTSFNFAFERFNIAQKWSGFFSRWIFFLFIVSASWSRFISWSKKFPSLSGVLLFIFFTTVSFYIARNLFSFLRYISLVLNKVLVVGDSIQLGESNFKILSITLFGTKLMNAEGRIFYYSIDQLLVEKISKEPEQKFVISRMTIPVAKIKEIYSSSELIKRAILELPYGVIPTSLQVRKGETLCEVTYKQWPPQAKQLTETAIYKELTKD